jgi:hypothetical protein
MPAESRLFLMAYFYSSKQLEQYWRWRCASDYPALSGRFTDASHSTADITQVMLSRQDSVNIYHSYQQ